MCDHDACGALQQKPWGLKGLLLSLELLEFLLSLWRPWTGEESILASAKDQRRLRQPWQAF